MANKNLFGSSGGAYVRPTDTKNLAAGDAYNLTDKQALAQYVMTGCLNATFYATAESQLMNILDTCKKVEPEFIAKLAVNAREKGYMKDTPALMLAYLSANGGREYLPKVFHRVIDNGKMLRNYVQIMRSGTVGRKSLGSLPRRMVREYFDRKSVPALLKDSIGNAPSLADVIKMVHPKPNHTEKAALFRYLVGKEVDDSQHHQVVVDLLRFRRGEGSHVAAVDFRFLTELQLTPTQWKEVALAMNWTALRMNLNTLQRHGVFDDANVMRHVAAKLADVEAIKAAKVFPYQLFAAYKHTEDAPAPIREALQDAMEIATANVPSFGDDCTVLICQDVSGSMSSPVTGYRGTVSSKINCVEVGALISSCLLRVNRYGKVFPFDTQVHQVQINPRDTVMTNAQKLNRHGGGTNCALPMQMLAASRGTLPEKVVVVYVSDNESWAHTGSEMMRAWELFRSRVKEAKLVCIDLTPNRTTQAHNSKDVLNIGGFSDQVFTVMESFVNNKMSGDHWVDVIEKTEI